MPAFTKTYLAALALAGSAAAGSLADIDHVVLFMQENRAFDHYFGTMAGVRNFADPNVQINNGTPVWYQKVTSQLSTAATSLLPWYLNYLHGSWNNATKCMTAGSNGWDANHHALNNGSNDLWAVGNTPWSWGHFTRKEIPNHFAIAEGFTVGDMYQESVIAATNPNRVTWLSGTINAPGAPPGNPNANGGMYIDNNETPGCESTALNCYPLKWETIAEFYEAAGVSWQVYQDTDNFDDNPLAWFAQFQTASNTSALGTKGMAYNGLQSFYAAAAAGTLPQVSIIIGPAELSEHPPYTPQDGAWLQQRIVDVVTQSPAYNKTALIISYDETGGWGDHVVPYHSPSGTSGEWIQDPYGKYGYVYTGPGFRLPFYIISPWTRGGNVYVEHADHNSQIMFVEKWLATKGHNVVSQNIPAWRRANMADLTAAFDFAHPDYSIPHMPNASYPSTTSSGDWNGYAVCEAQYPTTKPPVPYGAQDVTSALQTEQGFKKMRGNPTEGRFLTFEKNGYALASNNANFAASKSTAAHDTKAQRFYLTQTGSQFTITSVSDKKVVAGGEKYTIKDLGSGLGYSLQSASDGKFLYIGTDGKVVKCTSPEGFAVFSVTYSN